MIPEHWKPEFHPVAAPEVVVTNGPVRFTVLTSRLIRLEYDPKELFEDRPSQVFWNRHLSVPQFKKSISSDKVEIITDHLHLTYRTGAAGFSNETLTIQFLDTGKTWHFGDEDAYNLKGTYRTLDGINGAVSIPPGLVSQSGWMVYDDSRSLVFNQEGWIEPRFASETGVSGKMDLYFFGYGRSFRECIRDFCRIAGESPMIPRWVFGNWWSRYWAYTEEELTQLIKDFQTHEIPLSVCIIDMDWHLEGWTGYTWNREYFPEPEKFLSWLHEQGLRTALNLHPHDGVKPHESAYEEIAREMGVDPAGKEPVPFDIADPKFSKAYFEKLHHPIEAQGVDFWWMDWQQGKKTRLEGLDPLYWLNHLHYHDLGRDGKKRPMVFSRWSELGSHRYPIGFSGDTEVTWESLAFQPYFTTTAANVAYFYWSHDIGGHFLGAEDTELYTRWLQFGVFSPVMRIHATKNRFQDRRPWVHDAETLRIIRSYMRLRHALIPYIYTMVHLGHKDCQALIEPMYYVHPEIEEAYVCDSQYYFGTELLAAPFTTPLHPETRMSRQVVWLPEGDWYHFFTGEYQMGDRMTAVYGKLDEMPLFARAGAIVPLGPDAGWGNIDNPGAFDVHIFAGADREFAIYEDDGTTVAYRDSHCVTKMTQKWQPEKLEFTIYPAQGDIKLIPEKRTWRLIFSGVKKPDHIKCRINQMECASPEVTYDPVTERLTVQLPETQVSAMISVTLDVLSGSLLSRRDRSREKYEEMLMTFRAPSEGKNSAWEHYDAIRKDPEAIQMVAGILTPMQLQAICETVFDAGFELMGTHSNRKAIVLWNNTGLPQIKYAFTGRWGCYVGRDMAPKLMQLDFMHTYAAQTSKYRLNDTWNGSFSYGGILFNMKR